MSHRGIDRLEAEFRLGSVRAGAWVTIIVCIPAVVYAALGGGRSNRAVFVADWAVALLSGPTAFLLPWRRIIASRWREAVFLTWTMLDFALISIAVISDGGPASPVTALFYVPIVFVGTSYPTRSVTFVSFVGLGGYAALAAAYNQPLGRAVITLGGLGGAALMSSWQARIHERRRQQLAQASVTDPLTASLNRRGLDASAASAFAALDRFGTPLSLLILDLDKFKAYNDVHGHMSGDGLLVWAAAQIRRTLRPNDAFARIGGDEFAVIAAGADRSAAAVLAERISAICAPRAALSVGLASAPADGRDFDALYRVADGALYEAKRGRALGIDRTVPEPSIGRGGLGDPALGGR
jgi:diguanylate cyclase (GGDEF)-like protein